jgi:cobalt-zinc-cadmium efflux system outer membrane protein
MSLPANENFILTQEVFSPLQKDLKLKDEDALIKLALENNPGLLANKLGINLHEKKYSYERAMRIPDPSLKVGYDRGGNFLLDFIGFGISIDLPVFDRNRGNILAAAIELEKSRHIYDYSQLMLEREIKTAFRRFILAADFYENLSKEYDEDLSNIFLNLDESYRQRHLSLLEFIDFMDAYSSHKIVVLEASKKLILSIEELKSLIGTELF